MAQTKTVVINPTVDTAAYAAGDLIGAKITLTNFLSPGNFQATLHSVKVIDQAAQNASFDIVFFSADPSTTTFTDNAALDVSDADALNILGSVTVAASSYKALADNSASTTTGLNLRLSGSAATIYAALVCRGTPTYVAATDLRIKLIVEV